MKYQSPMQRLIAWLLEELSGIDSDQWAAYIAVLILVAMYVIAFVFYT